MALLCCLIRQIRQITHMRLAIVHIEDLLCEGTQYICMTDIGIKVFVVYY